MVEPDVKAVETEVTPAPPVAPTPKLDLGIDPELSSKSRDSALSAFIVSPTDVSFGESEQGEKILLLLRAHLVTLLPAALVTLVLLVMPVFILPLFSAIGLSGISAGAGFVITVFWYLAAATYVFLNFLYWYFNVYIVTNARIIVVDWYSVVVRKVSAMPIARIQDVSSSQVGVFSGMFDFGNVVVETAAAEENFEFVRVPYPQLVQKQLSEMIQKLGSEVGKSGV